MLPIGRNRVLSTDFCEQSGGEIDEHKDRVLLIRKKKKKEEEKTTKNKKDNEKLSLGESVTY